MQPPFDENQFRLNDNSDFHKTIVESKLGKFVRRKVEEKESQLKFVLGDSELSGHPNNPSRLSLVSNTASKNRSVMIKNRLLQRIRKLQIFQDVDEMFVDDLYERSEVANSQLYFSSLLEFRFN